MHKLLVIAKPDLVIRKGPGARMLSAILDRMAGSIDASTRLRIPLDVAERHYSNVRKRPFYPWLLRYIQSYESLVFIVNTPRAAEGIRAELGSTIVEKADPSSIRGKYGLRDGMNGLHVSESVEAGHAEVGIWTRAGILRPGKIGFDVWDYIADSEDHPDNTVKIRRILDETADFSTLANISTRYDSGLFRLLLQEAVGVPRPDLIRFYDAFMEGLLIH